MIEDTEREEIEKLLPWYVTGRLELSDTRKVERYLRQHPDVLPRLELVRAERQEALHANEAMGWPQSDMSERLMASLPQTATPASGRLLATFGQLFSMPPSPGLQWAALVMALLVLAQAAFITLLLTREPTYRLAEGSPGDGVPALIAFADDAKAVDVAQFLTDFNANIVDGPKPGGVYKIRLRVLDKSKPVTDALLSKLAERRDVVRIVLPSRD